MQGIKILPATKDDTGILPDFQFEAGLRFASIGMESVANMQAPDRADFESKRKHPETALLVAKHEDTITGFIAVESQSGVGFIEEVSVAMAHAGQRIGASLISAAEKWGLDRRLEQMYLTTFTQVPWNAPYYRRLGYQDCKATDAPPQIARHLKSEQDFFGSTSGFERTLMVKNLT